MQESQFTKRRTGFGILKDATIKESDRDTHNFCDTVSYPAEFRHVLNCLADMFLTEEEKAADKSTTAHDEKDVVDLTDPKEKVIHF